MKRLFRFAGIACIVLMLMGTLVVGHYALLGYRMYQDAVFVQSVEEKAEQIRSREGYIVSAD